MILGRLRNLLYVVMLAGFGGAAIAHLALSALETAMVAAGVAPPAWLGFGMPVPILRDFDDPPRRMVELLAPSPRYDATYTGDGMRERYISWHAPVLVSLAVAVLAIRRVRGWMRARVLAAPASFSGFVFGLGLVGMGAMLLGKMGGGRLVWPIEPITAGAILGFVAFVVAELGSLRTAREIPAAAGAGQAPRPRRRPVWTVLAIALPFAIAGGGWALASSMGSGSLAPVAILLIAIAAGFAFGAVATVIALVRRERWIPLQVVAFLLNFGAGLLLIARWAGP